MLFPERMMPYIAGAGLGSGALAFGLIGYVFLSKPVLLRTEKHEEINRLIDLVGDNEQPIEIRQGAQDTLIALATEPKILKDGKEGDGE